MAIFIDTPLPYGRQRIRERGQNNRFWHSRWDADETLYFQEIRLPSSFDLILAGSG